MHPLEIYYLNQAGRSLTHSGGSALSVQPRSTYAGHGIGNFFGSLFRWVRPILLSGAKAVGHETLRTGGKILTDIA